MLFSTLVDPPMISNQPSDQLDINEGQNATFTVMASGIMLIYQWMKDGAVISDIADLYSGTMSGTLTVESVDASDEGEYTVSVMNTEATVVSMPVATLTVRKLTLLFHTFIPPNCSRMITYRTI